MTTSMQEAMAGALVKAAEKPTPTVHGAQKAHLAYIPVDDIDVAKNVRKTFSEAKLEELTASVRANGIIQPLIVRVVARRYQLVAGERRLRAAKRAGLEEVPCVVRDMGDAKALEAQLVENTHREDMNPVDEAFGVKELHEKINLTQEVTANLLGKTQNYVATMIAITTLPAPALNALLAGVFTRKVAYEITKLKTPALRVEATRRLAPQGKASRRVTFNSALRVIRELLAADQQSAQKPATRDRSAAKNYTRNWKFWLLQMSAREFGEFVEICAGRHNDSVMAEAVDVVMRARENASKQAVVVAKGDGAKAGA